MFGLGKEKKGPAFGEWEFDLEKELKDAGAMRKQKEEINQRTQELKTMLRQGEDQKSFDETQTLLHGYLAAQKVIGRIGRKL